MDHSEIYKFMSHCDQKVQIESDFEGIRIVFDNHSYVLYLTEQDVKTLVNCLEKAVTFQKEKK